MKSILLIVIFLVVSSCTEGQKTVEINAAKAPVQPSHLRSGDTGRPRPADPEEVFAPLGYPFTRNTFPFNLTIAISNPGNLEFTHEWFLDDVLDATRGTN